MATQAATPAEEGVTFLGHPIALFVLFFTEFWERFSFYGMRALLVLYMVDQVAGLGYADERAYSVYGAYGAMVYATPVVGGLLADRLLGYRQAIVLGAVLMALGHFTMAIEHEIFFYAALGLLILGNGFFKPNISSLVGKLYGEGDPRRDSAFTIFYMGINAGAALSPVLCGGIAALMATRDASGRIVEMGWHYGFGLAGVGMVLGLLGFLVFQRHLGDKGLPPELPVRAPLQRVLQAVTWVAPLFVLPVCMGLVTRDDVLGWSLNLIGVATFGYLFVHALMSPRVERDRMLVVLVLMFFSMLFWAFFEQAGSSINLFTDRNVDRSFFGTEIPAAAFQSVNPIFILLLAPIFATIWTRLGRRGRDPSAPLKFGLGILQLGLGFAILWYGARQADQQGLTWMGWVVLGYMLQTMGELCLSPVGLSMVTKLSPSRMVGLVMGAWFLATAFSHYLGARVAALTGTTGEVDPSAGAAVYGEVFGSIGAFAVTVGLVLMLFSPVLARRMHLDGANGEPSRVAA